MGLGFPRYTASFECECSIQESMKRIIDVASCTNNCLQTVKASYSGTQKIVLNAHTGGYIYYNSFLPVVEIDIGTIESGSLYSITFELRRSVKTIITIISIFAVLYEIALLVFWLTDQLSAIILLCLPIGILLFMFVLSSVGLKLASKRILRILFEAITQKSAKSLSLLYKH